MHTIILETVLIIAIVKGFGCLLYHSKVHIESRVGFSVIVDSEGLIIILCIYS